MTHEFKHPKYYDELRKKRKEFQKQQKELGEKAMKDEATSNKQLLGVLDNLIIRLYKIVKERIKI